MASGLKKRHDMFASALVDESGAVQGIYTRCPHCGMVDLRHMNQGIKYSHFLIWNARGIEKYQCGKCRNCFFTIRLQVPVDMDPLKFYEQINTLLLPENKE